MAPDNPEIVCLLAAGTSIPAGMPTTAEITEKVIPPRDFYRHTSDVYTLNWRGFINEILFDFQKESRNAIVATVEAARDLTTMGFRNLGIPVEGLNYEDVAFTLGQIHDAEGGGRDDPLAAFGRRFIARRVSSYLPGEIDLLNLLFRTVKCLTDLVAEMLWREPQTTAHLGFLVDAIKELGSSSMVIVTTNHDILLERHLRGAGVMFDDGFSDPINGARLWRPANSFGRIGHVQLLKIHGSINWFDLMPPEDWHFKGEFAQPDDPQCNLHLYKHPDGDVWRLRASQPQILIGTLNKTDSYTEGMYAELFCRWRSALMRCRKLLICGYGFHDHGINRLLLNWGFADRDRRMVVVDPNHETAHKRMKPGMSRRLRELFDNGVLVPIESGVEGISWADIKQSMSRQGTN